jgi:hypothetical protein
MTTADTTVPILAPRVIYESPPLDQLDLDEDERRRAEVYAQRDRAEVAVVDIFGTHTLWLHAIGDKSLASSGSVGPVRYCRLRSGTNLVPRTNPRAPVSHGQ